MIPWIAQSQPQTHKVKPLLLLTNPIRHKAIPCLVHKIPLTHLKHGIGSRKFALNENEMEKCSTKSSGKVTPNLHGNQRSTSAQPSYKNINCRLHKEEATEERKANNRSHSSVAG